MKSGVKHSRELHKLVSRGIKVDKSIDRESTTVADLRFSENSDTYHIIVDRFTKNYLSGKSYGTPRGCNMTDDISYARAFRSSKFAEKVMKSISNYSEGLVDLEVVPYSIVGGFLND